MFECTNATTTSGTSSTNIPDSDISVTSTCPCINNIEINIPKIYSSSRISPPVHTFMTKTAQV